MTDMQAWAKLYEDRGFLPLPIEYKSKKPAISGWQDGRSHAKQINGRHGIGCVMGPRFVDVDLDTPAAQAAALFILPPTEAVFRRGGDRTHYLYEVSTPVAYIDMGPVELRSGKGHQTVFPPSIHPSGETLAWEWWASALMEPNPSDPAMPQLAVVDSNTLVHCAHTLAALALMAGEAVPGNFHQISLSMAGLLYHRGIPAEQAVSAVETALIVRGSDGKGKAENVGRTYSRGEEGGTVQVWSGLEDLGLSKLVERARALAPCHDEEQSDPLEDFASPIPELEPVPQVENYFTTRLIDAGTLTGEPPLRTWAWDQWIPNGVITGLAGPPGIAKSTLALQLAIHKALGIPFLGADIPQGKAVFLTVEDDLPELWRRVRHICDALFTDVSELQGKLWLGPLAEHDPLLVRLHKDIPRATPQLRDLYQFTQGFSLGVLDLLGDFWDGSDNIKSQVSPYIRRFLGMMASKNNMGWVGISHPSVAAGADGRGFAGSTGVLGSYRSAITMERIPNVDAIKLRRVKANYAALDEGTLQWREGYLHETTLADPVTVAQLERAAAWAPVKEALETFPEWASTREVWMALGGHSKGVGPVDHHEKGVEKLLRELVANGEVELSWLPAATRGQSKAAWRLLNGWEG